MPANTPAWGEGVWDRPRRPSETRLRRSSTAPPLVWGRVVEDIPASCRELVAALAEEG